MIQGPPSQCSVTIYRNGVGRGWGVQEGGGIPIPMADSFNIRQNDKNIIIILQLKIN